VTHRRPWTHPNWAPVMGMAAFVIFLNILGWSVLLWVVAPQNLPVGSQGAFGVGLGVTAWLLGARHAFDADHIAAIDNTTRKLVGEGRPAQGTGFWFSLGHSSVVFGLSLLLAIGVRVLADPVQNESSSLQHSLGVFGSLVAGTFLIIIGLMNLAALRGVLHLFQHLRAGEFDEDLLEHHLHNRGFIARLFKGATRRVSRPWHLYPVGLLMGLGFDTASQVALLVLAGGVAAFALPWYAILTLPVLFAGGMALFDTIDGVFMARAYEWAFLRPVRKIYYNLTVTTLSVVVALVIGVIVLAQLAAKELDIGTGPLGWVSAWDLQSVGMVIAGLFVTVWALSVAIWKLGRIEERYDPSEQPVVASLDK
jgi:high-affinity nickel-transport protein